MKTATVRDLRNAFPRVSKWVEAGETVQIVKRGKPFARLVPEPQARPLLGCVQGTGNVPGDLEEPAPVHWEAAQ